LLNTMKVDNNFVKITVTQIIMCMWAYYLQTTNYKMAEAPTCEGEMT
jgi:hypothetical protein